MRTTQTWLNEHLEMYKQDQNETLIELLETTISVIEQYVRCPESKLTFGVLESCMKHNKLFLESINRESL